MMPLSGAALPKRLLLAEDDLQLQRSLAELLESDGYDVTVAANGSEALEALREQPRPDVILLDLMMPVKDGWQFRIEQKRDPTLSAIPVVAMSADDTPKAAAIDADIYLRKPFQYATLTGAIQQVIELRNLAHLDRLGALATLAAGFTHEIDNPLTYVIASLHQLEEELPRLFRECAQPARSAATFGTSAVEPGASQASSPSSAAINRIAQVGTRLREALDGAERIRSILHHVKTFSRASDEHRSPLDVRSVLDSSVNVVLSEIRRRARLIKDYRNAPLIMANPGRLAQVFLNLLINATQAIAPGSPESNFVRVATRAAGPGRALVEIADSGSGIPGSLRERIFDPFFTTKPPGVGTGLGLSICHGIVTSLGGEIMVESEMDKGTIFRVVLPAAPMACSAPGLSHSEPVLEETSRAAPLVSAGGAAGAPATAGTAKRREPTVAESAEIPAPDAAGRHREPAQ